MLSNPKVVTNLLLDIINEFFVSFVITSPIIILLLLSFLFMDHKFFQEPTSDQSVANPLL